MATRDYSLDFLRFLGVLIIMIAHADPPSWLFNLRNFGTPLLIVASAATYSLIYRDRKLVAVDFLRRRMMRLTIPAWVFLTLFFLVYWTMSRTTTASFPFDTKDILDSYAFRGGIGFVWIFSVYIFLALITPVTLRLSKLGTPPGLYGAALCVVYVVYESVLSVPSVNIAIRQPGSSVAVAAQLVPYTLLFMYGLRIHECNNRCLIVLGGFSFTVYLVLALALSDGGEFVSTQSYKYPPQLYYLSYAIFAVNFVYLTVVRLGTVQRIKGAVVWLSRNSLWIYLWHIAAIYILRLMAFSVSSQLGEAAVKAVFLLSFGIVVTAIQIRLIGHFTACLERRGHHRTAAAGRLVFG